MAVFRRPVSAEVWEALQRRRGDRARPDGRVVVEGTAYDDVHLGPGDVINLVPYNGVWMTPEDAAAKRRDGK